MHHRNLFIIVLLLFTAMLIQSCTIEDVTDLPQNKITSPAFDTLQGKWKHQYTTYLPVTGGPGIALPEIDSIQFNSDLTGIDHFPQAPVNFTYDLLPGDTTLIFNTGPISNPIYDTVIISKLNAHDLVYKSKKKFVTSLAGYYFLLSVLKKL